MLRPGGADAPLALGWETEKPVWERLRADRLRMHLPPEKILLLKP